MLYDFTRILSAHTCILPPACPWFPCWLGNTFSMKSSPVSLGFRINHSLLCSPKCLEYFNHSISNIVLPVLIHISVQIASRFVSCVWHNPWRKASNQCLLKTWIKVLNLWICSLQYWKRQKKKAGGERGRPHVKIFEGWSQGLLTYRMIPMTGESNIMEEKFMKGIKCFDNPAKFYPLNYDVIIFIYIYPYLQSSLFYYSFFYLSSSLWNNFTSFWSKENVFLLFTFLSHILAR